MRSGSHVQHTNAILPDAVPIPQPQVPEPLARQVSQASRMSNSTSGYSINFNMTGTNIPDVGSMPPLNVGSPDFNHPHEAPSYSFQLSRTSPTEQEAIAGNQT